MNAPLDVTIVGGGMITHDQILPSIYHLQRLGVIGRIKVCALNSAPLRELQTAEDLNHAFPDQRFTPFPELSAPDDAMYPELYKDAIADMGARQCVIVAVPDQFHYAIVKHALAAKQHVICVKPLVLKHEQAKELEQIGRENGLFIGIEYHKRFDRRALIARRAYRRGDFGDFVIGDAKLIEPYYYRHSNFQNWFSPENTDPFVYVGCHYTDLTTFITGLRPVSASVVGVEGTFPNGNPGYLWSHGRIGFEHGAYLSVITGLGYPDDGGGSNDQGMTLFCEGRERNGLVVHDDQYRGVIHGVQDGKRYKYVNPDYFQYVPWAGDGFKPVGYGYDSVVALVDAVAKIETDAGSNLAARREIIRDIDDRGLLATPANSSYNEKLHEAARESIRSNGRRVDIEY